jgi:hypothetical protein
MRSQGTAAELERRRFRAVKLVEEGVPRKWIVRVLGVSQGALSRWWHLGCPRRLTDEDYQRLNQVIWQASSASCICWSNLH